MEHPPPTQLWSDPGSANKSIPFPTEETPEPETHGLAGNVTESITGQGSLKNVIALQWKLCPASPAAPCLGNKLRGSGCCHGSKLNGRSNKYHCRKKKKNQTLFTLMSAQQGLYTRGGGRGGLSATELLPTGCPRWPRPLEAAEPAFMKEEVARPVSGEEEAWHRGGCRWVQWTPFHMGYPPVCEACLPLYLPPASSMLLLPTPSSLICQRLASVLPSLLLRSALRLGQEKVLRSVCSPVEGQECGGVWESAQYSVRLQQVGRARGPGAGGGSPMCEGGQGSGGKDIR